MPPKKPSKASNKSNIKRSNSTGHPRRTKGNGDSRPPPNSTTLSRTLALIDALQSANDIDSLRIELSKLRRVIAKDDKVRSGIASKKARLIVLITCLKRTGDENVILDVISILSAIVQNISRAALKLCKAGAIDALLRLLGKNILRNDHSMGQAYGLITYLTPHERRFSTMFRLSGALQVTMSYLKQKKNEYKLIVPVLKVMTVAANNKLNVASMHKGSMLALLLAILKLLAAGRMGVTLKHASLCLAQMIASSETVAAAFIGKLGIKSVLSYFIQWNTSDIRNKHTEARVALLAILKATSAHEIGRTALRVQGAITVLYGQIQKLSDAPEVESLLSMMALILKRCMPMLTMPSCQTDVSVPLPDPGGLQLPTEHKRRKSTGKSKGRSPRGSREASPVASPAMRARRIAQRNTVEGSSCDGTASGEGTGLEPLTLNKAELKVGVEFTPEAHLDDDLAKAFLLSCIAQPPVEAKSHRLFRSTLTPPSLASLDLASVAKEPLVESHTKLKRMLLIDDIESLQASDVDQKLVYDLDDSSVRGDGKTLQFDSRFECGNLRQAYQMFGQTYDLILNVDTHATGFFQWFYFRVSNVQVDTSYKLNILNNEKPGSQFNNGMQPVLYDPQRNTWIRAGSKIVYQRNAYLRSKTKSSTNYYWTLSFGISFPHEGPFYLAYHYPFSYTDNQHWLNEMIAACHKQALPIVHRQLLCATMAGNRCELLTITDTSSAAVLERAIDDRPVIVLSARVHPGETNSSWMMKGAVEFLLSSHSDAQELRKLFVFKVIPMLNPDGVIHGNTRCSLAGQDLNRQWIQPDCVRHAPVYHLKLLLRSLIASGRQPAMFVDMHGHSRRKNVFCYGCRHGSVPGEEQLLIDVLSQEAHLFSSRNSKFGLEKSKEATGRVVAWKLGIQCSYTMEATYCGADQGKYQGYQINTQHLEEMGMQFVKSLSTWDACKHAMQTGLSSRASTEPDLDIRGMSPVHMLVLRKGSSSAFLDNRGDDIDEEDEVDDDNVNDDVEASSDGELDEEDDDSDSPSGDENDACLSDDQDDKPSLAVLSRSSLGRVSLSASTTPSTTASPVEPPRGAQVGLKPKARISYAEL
eukprot:TRINITY_DN11017_c0_g1_i2.p1 TRINITY_DN11017_c0_g1~~TRINITY_DN11017_c0_g1_i2.p1  ORF type:complete len:1094 (+),score=218.82 TRINITY_DN11017_c0_g1_i2:60-3341(+)